MVPGVSIVAIGLFVFVTGNRNQQTQTRNAGAGIIFLAMLIVLLTIFVDTPKKIARRESAQLVQDAVNGNWTHFKTLLEAGVTLARPAHRRCTPTPTNSPPVARAGTERVHLKEAHIRSLQVTESGSLVTTTLQILSEQDDPAAPMIDSSWQFDFQKTGNDWRIHEILRRPDRTNERRRGGGVYAQSRQVKPTVGTPNDEMEAAADPRVPFCNLQFHFAILNV